MERNPETEVPLLELKKVSKTYQQTGQEVLKEIDLTVHEGDFLAITGSSGSGKSTLLNILGLLDTPSKGSYHFLGRSLEKLTPQQADQMRSQHLGFVFQASNMLLEESLLANVQLGLRIQGRSKQESRDKALQALELLGLERKAEQKTKLLSGGEKQRAALARAIAPRPQLLLADEPTGNLDEENTEKVLQALENLHSQGHTIILITHEAEVAARAQRIIQLKGGEISEVESEKRANPSRRKLVQDSSITERKQKKEVLKNDLADSLSALLSKPLRSLLIALAFALGTGGLTLTQGMSLSAAQQVQGRILEAESQSVRFLYHGNNPEDALDRQEVLERTLSLPGVKSAGVQTYLTPADILYRYREEEAREPLEAKEIGAVALGGERAQQIGLETYPWQAAGLLKLDNLPTGHLPALISREAAQDLGFTYPQGQPNYLLPGLTLWVGERQVSIQGIFETQDPDPIYQRSLILPLEAIDSTPASQTEYFAQVEPGYARPLAQALPLAISPAASGDVSVDITSDLRAVSQGVSQDLAYFIFALSLVMLTLAALSAGTVFFLSVQARTSEIALRRALGASRLSLARIFLGEGLTTGLVGGSCGALAGTLLLLALAQGQGWQAMISPHALPLALLLGALSGVISAAYPAWVASRKSPALAMREGA